MEAVKDDWRGGAEAVLNLGTDSTISIGYHSLFGPHDDLLLLEADDHLLSNILHHRVTMRGQPDEEAVLCTDSKTYAIKFVGTSNSMLLVPPGDLVPGEGSPTVAASIVKVAPGNMELVEVAPRLDKLKSLLSERPYVPDNEEEGVQSEAGLYSWEDLVECVQASDGELMDELRALSAIEIHGHWRIVDERVMDEILNVLIHNSVLFEWALDSLKEDEVITALEADGFSRILASHCLGMYARRVDENIWGVDEKRVCLHFALKALKGGKMKLEQFMDKWARSVPSGMQVELEMLEGEVLLERVGVETWIRAFSASSLPSIPAARFAALFKERPKWEWKDLQPYIRDLHVPGISLEGLLIKYTRKSQPNPDSEPIFSSR
ncbi:hypothetical protein QJS10_CPB04g01951 [Acorus calamus]|uniref:Sister chromatid cohesion protein DCC1 n=1 Tax=Acorus calamus TaxID=4465 RepID=A0AAV9EZD9_ACOCL|nr:hypothetical protein QJS10_CPB04g01951 [Acorus calamus]